MNATRQKRCVRDAPFLGKKRVLGAPSFAPYSEERVGDGQAKHHAGAFTANYLPIGPPPFAFSEGWGTRAPYLGRGHTVSLRLGSTNGECCCSAGSPKRIGDHEPFLAVPPYPPGASPAPLSSSSVAILVPVTTATPDYHCRRCRRRCMFKS